MRRIVRRGAATIAALGIVAGAALGVAATPAQAAASHSTTASQHSLPPVDWWW